MPLVLLHGVGHGPTAWQPVVDVVGLSRPVLAPWLRGLRPGRQEDFDLDAAVGAVTQQLQLYGHQRIALVGLSLGAVVATRLAATEPELIDRLLLAVPMLTPPRWLLAAQRGAVALTPRRMFTQQGITKESVRSALAAVGGLDLRSDLGRLPVAPLLVVGGSDRAGLAAATEIEARLPQAERRTVPGSGPDLLRDAGAEFARFVADWLTAPVRSANRTEPPDTEHD